jgi:hypothetical protein
MRHRLARKVALASLLGLSALQTACPPPWWFHRHERREERYDHRDDRHDDRHERHDDRHGDRDERRDDRRERD